MKQAELQHNETWIWLPEALYPDCQTTIYSGFCDKTEGNYTVAELVRDYAFDKEIASVRLRFSGDTVFQLFCNGAPVATGPAAVGGDFIGNDRPRENFYSFETELFPASDRLSFLARVRMMPVGISEYSKGHGGFMLFGTVTFRDGTRTLLRTDESWMIRRNGAYTAPLCYDGRITPDPFVPAEPIHDRWHTVKAPIPPREEEERIPEGGRMTLLPREERETVLELDKIYAGFVQVRAATEGPLFAEISCRELDEAPRKKERIVFAADGLYRGFTLHSAGNLHIKVRNESDSPASLTVSLVTTCYPVGETARTVTSDAELDRVLEVCRHTLRYCRQTHHLDSPRHSEPLACTGDYAIESLMTVFSFGDMRLAEFDLVRTAELLVRERGRMFHTTYSLIWARMLYDVYMVTGHRALLETCEEALMLLLSRFETYLGDNGLLETPPDYMFVDWIYLDGLSLHHPPKALGQTCLNLFYFDALGAAASVYEALGRFAMAKDCQGRRARLGEAVNEQLYDAERGLYFEGLNTPTDERLLGKWMPQNTDRRYYRKHANILAAYVGVCDGARARRLLRGVLSEEIEGDIQPYFTHYLLEAVYRWGLREEYTRTILERWKESVQLCPKGLAEGFVPPEPTYRFDHSHAWGGTPLYSLPKALMGLEILEPGMTALRLSPSLLGLTEARVELPTPYGMVVCEMKKGQEVRITHPDAVTVVIAEP